MNSQTSSEREEENQLQEAHNKLCSVLLHRAQLLKSLAEFPKVKQGNTSAASLMSMNVSLEESETTVNETKDIISAYLYSQYVNITQKAESILVSLEDDLSGNNKERSKISHGAGSSTTSMPSATNCCDICYQSKSERKYVTLFCGHIYCETCMRSMFINKMSTKCTLQEPTSLLPQCCNIPFDCSLADKFLPASEAKNFRKFYGTAMKKWKEKAPRDILPAARSRKEKEWDEQFWRLKKEKGWTSCPSCHYVVERTTGCKHMTCRCGTSFNYSID